MGRAGREDPGAISPTCEVGQPRLGNVTAAGHSAWRREEHDQQRRLFERGDGQGKKKKGLERNKQGLAWGEQWERLSSPLPDPCAEEAFAPSSPSRAMWESPGCSVQNEGLLPKASRRWRPVGVLPNGTRGDAATSPTVRLCRAPAFNLFRGSPVPRRQADDAAGFAIRRERWLPPSGRNGERVSVLGPRRLCWRRGLGLGSPWAWGFPWPPWSSSALLSAGSRVGSRQSKVSRGREGVSTLWDQTQKEASSMARLARSASWAMWGRGRSGSGAGAVGLDPAPPLKALSPADDRQTEPG